MALVRGNTVLEATSEAMTKGQAERLMGLLESMLHKHGTTFQDLTAIGVGVGPGNFTGIRIGVSLARGLALGLGVPACGINGFEQRQDIHLHGALISVPAPRDMVYVLHDGTAALMTRAEAEALGPLMPEDPTPDTCAASIAKLAAQRFASETRAPAPYYLRAPDAAPAKDAPPPMLP